MLDWILDNIGLLSFLLIMLLGFSSSKKKKRRRQQQQNGSPRKAEDGFGKKIIEYLDSLEEETAGSEGMPGSEGQPGPEGVWGSNGRPGSEGVPGSNGWQGSEGIPGSNGWAGSNGRPAVSCLPQTKRKPWQDIQDDSNIEEKSVRRQRQGISGEAPAASVARGTENKPERKQDGNHLQSGFPGVNTGNSLTDAVILSEILGAPKSMQ